MGDESRIQLPFTLHSKSIHTPFTLHSNSFKCHSKPIQNLNTSFTWIQILNRIWIDQPRRHGHRWIGDEWDLNDVEWELNGPFNSYSTSIHYRRWIGYWTGIEWSIQLLFNVYSILILNGSWTDLNMIWMNFEWELNRPAGTTALMLNGIWMAFEWVLNGLWMGLNGFWMGFEWVWMECEWSVNGFWMECEWKLNSRFISHSSIPSHPFWSKLFNETF